MLDNNETSFTLTKNPKSQNRTKHINVIYHHIQRLVKDGELGIKGYLVYWCLLMALQNPYQQVRLKVIEKNEA